MNFNLVASGDTNLLFPPTRHRENNTVPEGPPWALSDGELSQFKELGLEEIRRDRFLEGEEVIIEQLRIEYRRNPL